MYWKDSENAFHLHRGTLALVGLASLSCLLAGCLSMQVPEKFLLDKSSSEGLKAISPDEAKLWVREFSESDQGDFDFWAEALRTEFVDHRGYTLIEENKVKDKEEREGLELVFEMTVQGIPHRYMVTLFVLEGMSSNTIRVAEFVARMQAFEKYLADVRKSVLTIQRGLW